MLGDQCPQLTYENHKDPVPAQPGTFLRFLKLFKKNRILFDSLPLL